MINPSLRMAKRFRLRQNWALLSSQSCLLQSRAEQYALLLIDLFSEEKQSAYVIYESLQVDSADIIRYLNNSSIAKALPAQ